MGDDVLPSLEQLALLFSLLSVLPVFGDLLGLPILPTVVQRVRNDGLWSYLLDLSTNDSCQAVSPSAWRHGLPCGVC